MIYLITILTLTIAAYLVWSSLKMRKMREQNYKLRAVVDNQEDYTFLVNRDFEVKATNLTYRLHTKDGEPDMLGNVLHCKNAYHVGRCGESENCGSCPLRFVIRKSFERESGFTGMNACMEVYDQNEQVVDVDVQVEGHYVHVGHQGHMVINVKDKTKKNGGNLPKVLLVTDNMSLYDTVRQELSNEFRVLNADNEHQAYHRLQLASDYHFYAVMTDRKFFLEHEDVLRLLINSHELPLFVFGLEGPLEDKEGIYPIGEQIDGKELTKQLLIAGSTSVS